MEDKYYIESVRLLQSLISVPSFSDEEDRAADLWEEWLKTQGAKKIGRFHNNVYAVSDNYEEGKPLLLLNSHLDTVRPVSSYSIDPFNPVISDGKLFGLGSNDAGGAGVTLASTFLKFKDNKDLPFNLLLAITASEERMGELGMRSFLPFLREQGLYPDYAIVGEPTGCEAAIAERGLVVCDAESEGVAGHAARSTGVNAIYRACEDIERLKNIQWDKTSEILGPVKVTVTMIDAGTQHNIIPDKCHYVLDVRTTDAYSNEDTVEIIQKSVNWSKIQPRSTRIRASVLSTDSPLVKAAECLKIKLFISPTTSDMALMYDIPSIKMGPGRSERSHTANEYIELEEIREGLKVYEKYISSLANVLRN